MWAALYCIPEYYGPYIVPPPPATGASPKIITQPESVYIIRDPMPNATLAFTCVVTGDPVPSVEWFKAGTKVEADEMGVVVISESDTAEGLMSNLSITYTVDNVDTYASRDGTLYHCAASNGLGIVHSYTVKASIACKLTTDSCMLLTIMTMYKSIH